MLRMGGKCKAGDCGFASGKSIACFPEIRWEDGGKEGEGNDCFVGRKEC